MTNNVASWEDKRNCNTLSPEEADRILFPGNGKVGSRGAPKDVKRLCNGCPVRRECLIWAIENDLDGNWAETNKKQRRQFAKVQHIFVRPVEAVMPDEPKLVNDSGKRISRYLIVKRTVETHASWLDDAVSPFD